MRKSIRSTAWTTLAALLAAGSAGSVSAPAGAQRVTASPNQVLELSTGGGRLVTLSRPMHDVFVADNKVADVQPRSPTQLYIFAKGPGETTIYASSKTGGVVFSATVRVGTNLDSVGPMLRSAMPDAQIHAKSMNGVVLLTGTVANPEDAAEAERLTQAFVGDGTKVLSRLRTATPLQVNLQVKFVEVNRAFMKTVGVNLLSRDNSGGFIFGIGSGTRSPGTIGNIDISKYPTAPVTLPTGQTVTLPFNPSNGQYINPGNPGTAYGITKGEAFTSLGLAGHLLGLDILSAIDLGESNNQVTLLANPNLTALSGETGTFLAGGELPIPIAQALGSVTVEYKQYGVSLAYTPTVLADGRISLRVRPEVSQLDYGNAVTFGGTRIPALTTRRAETTLELGSGQSMVIGGLLQNSHNNTIDKAPFLGDLPILGALFRSNGFQRNETELVIVITPYLVKPVDANSIAMPSDGYRAPTDAARILLGQTVNGQSGGDRPKPSIAPGSGYAPAPAIGAAAAVPVAPPADRRKSGKAKPAQSATPGFSF